MPWHDRKHDTIRDIIYHGRLVGLTHSCFPYELLHLFERFLCLHALVKERVLSVIHSQPPETVLNE